MKDSFAFTLAVDTLPQGSALRIALADYLASLWKYRSTPVLREIIKSLVPLLRRARAAGTDAHGARSVQRVPAEELAGKP